MRATSPPRLEPALCLLGGILACSCSAPYEPDLQFWPGDAQLAATQGAASPVGGNANGGSGTLPGGSAGLGGTDSNTTGGVLGLGGSFAGVAGSSPEGGTSGSSGADNFGGTPNFGGTSNLGGAANFGGAASAGGNAGGSTSSSECSLSVKVTTAAAGGRYAPRNIGAVWVADQSGNFIRSLEVWAQRRASNLTQWNSATSKAGVAGSRVDIVSQATLSTHMAHTSTWNCQDFNKRPVPDGTYRVYFEMSDSGANGPNRFEVFTKGPTAATSNPPDNNNFKSIQLSFQP
jgi:hypothetical protein